MVKKEEALEVEGTVTQALANTRFRVQLDTGNEVLAHVAGKMRKHFIAWATASMSRCLPKTSARPASPSAIADGAYFFLSFPLLLFAASSQSASCGST